MTKEELLTQLREIKTAVDNDTAALQLTNEEQAKDVSLQKDYIRLEITQLQQKLSNDDNYVLEEYKELQEKIAKIGKNQLSLRMTASLNLGAITGLEREISEIDREIDAAKALWGELQQVSQLDEDAKKYLTTEIDALESRRTACKNSLDAAIQQKANYESQTVTYESELQLYQQRLSLLTSATDTAKKEEDNSKLEKLNSRLEIISANNPYLLYNFSNDIADLIENVEAGYITNEGVINRLNILSTKYPKKDEEKINEQLETNHNAQTIISKEIEELEEKLANDINYTPSRLQKDRLEEEISSLETLEGNYSAAIASISADISSQESLGVGIEENIERTIERKEVLETENHGLEIRLMLEPLEPSQSKEITKRISKNKTAIKKAEGDLEKYRKELSANMDIVRSLEMRRKSLETRKAQETRKKEDRQKVIEDVTTIDVVMQDADKNRLAILLNQLTSLKATEAAINYDYETHVKQLQESLKSLPVEKNQESVVPTLTNEPEIISTNEEEIDFDPSLENEPNFILPPLSDDLEEQNVESTDAIDAEYEQIKNEPIPIVLWKKAKNKILEKIRDNQFIKSAKATFAAMIIALSLGVALSKCSSSKSNLEVPPVVTEDFNDEIDDDFVLEEVEPDKIEDQDTQTEPEETPEEIEKPNLSEPTDEVEKPNQNEPTDEVEKPNLNEPTDEVEKPNQNEPTDEVEKPNLNEPTDEVEKPNLNEPTDEIEQIVTSGQVGVLSTGTGENQNVTVTENEASQVLTDAAYELAERYAQETNSSIATPFEDDNVTHYSIGEEGEINLSASTGISEPEITIEDVVEEMAQENYGVPEAGEKSLDDLFGAINNEVLNELSEEGKVR